MASSGTDATADTSVALIQASLDETKQFLAPHATADWSGMYYQYTNRLAHLYLLRQLNGLPTCLINVYFVNDNEMGGPATVEEWQSAVKLMKQYLGIEKTPLDKHIVDLFFDVRQL